MSKTLAKINDASSKIGAASKIGAGVASKVGATGTAAALGGAATLAGGLGGAYGLYQTFDNLDHMHSDRGAFSGGASGAALGASVGSVIPGVGTLIGGVAGGLLGAAGGKFGKKLWGSSKGKDQVQRDAMRSKLEEVNFLEDNGRYVLSDGTVFEMGKDGGFRYDDGLAAYEVDHNDPMQGVIFGHTLPLAEIITGGDDELTAAFAGYMTRAATSNVKDKDLTKALDNVKDMANKLGVDSNKASKVLNQFANESRVNIDHIPAYQAAMDNIFADERNLNFAALYGNNDDANFGHGSAKPSKETHTISQRVANASPDAIWYRIEGAANAVQPAYFDNIDTTGVTKPIVGDSILGKADDM
jgi:hypothetical protein